jgi:hypothetical protein
VSNPQGPGSLAPDSGEPQDEPQRSERGGTDRAAPDRLAELEEERRFLLRSIADLERERAAGDVEDDDYHALRDGYTARAAAVLRAIEEGRAGLPAKRPRNWRRLIATVAAVVLVAAVAGWLVARQSGQRLPGDTITGGTSPNQVATLLSEGRVLMANNAIQEASDRYLAVLEIERDNVEALTYAGWLLAISSGGGSTESGAATLGAAKAFLQDAIAIDPNYADPHCFLSLIAVSIDADLAGAQTFADECNAHNPPNDLRLLVQETLTEATAAAAAASPTTTTTMGATATTGGPGTAG